MNNIYDNGNYMLGQVGKIREHIDKLFRKDQINEETWKQLAKELVYHNTTDIVSINYENNMGISIDVWEEKDLVEEV